MSLKKDILECQKCEIIRNVNHKVIYRGNKNPVILFIGEAPGYQEDKEGLPFVGISGKLLDEWIKLLGVNFGIINVIKCRPPQNRRPTKEETINCAPFLWKQIDNYKAKIIVPLGITATRFLLGDVNGMLSLAGKSYKEYGKIIFPIPHPSYFIRRGRKGWRRYIIKLKEILKSSNI